MSIQPHLDNLVSAAKCLVAKSDMIIKVTVAKVKINVFGFFVVVVTVATEK